MSSTLVSCSNDSSSKNSPITANFSVTASGQDAVATSIYQKTFSWILPSALALSPAPLEDANGQSVNLEQAWIVLKKIQFSSNALGEAEEYTDQTAHYQGPFVIDLLSDQPVDFGEIQLSASGLRRVKMLLHKGHHIPATAPATLNGKSIYLEGSVNGYNFSYAADDTTDFDISGPTTIFPEKGKDLLVVIRVADLFKKIDLSGINANTMISSTARFPMANPCPQIHATATDLYTCFRKGIAQAAKFGKDNGDKDLDENDSIVNE